MFIYSEQARPYGLLSIFAYTPIFYEGQVWTRAVDYIYGNFFVPGPFRDQIVDYKGTNISELFYWLVNKLLKNTFEQALNEGVLERLNSNLEMRERLLKYSQVVVPDHPKLEKVYNTWLTGGDQDISEKKKLVSGLLHALVDMGVDLRDDVPLEDVQHFKAETSNLKDNDPALKYGADLIPYLKHRARYEKQLKAFKRKVLTKLLNHVIEQEQPGVTNVNKVRQERLADMTKDQVESLTENAYQKYLQGHLGHLRLESEPKKVPFKRSSILNLSQDWRNPLYIYAEIPITMSVGNLETRFRSIIHYAYHKMFKVIGVDLDTSRYEFHDLENIFAHERTRSLRSIIVEATEIALQVKFGQYPSLLTLLKLTGDEPLYWADRDDFILGQGKGDGENVVGKFLMYLRAQPKVRTYPKPTDGDPILSDIYLVTWITDRFKDVFNTLTLFKVPAESIIPILRRLYGLPKVKGAQPVECPPDLQAYLANLLPNYSRVSFNLVWLLLSDLIYILLQLSPDTRVKLVTQAQYNLLKPKDPVDTETNTDTDDSLALKYLTDFYYDHRKLIKVNSEYTFASDITSVFPSHGRGRYNVFSNAKKARLRYFAELQERKAELNIEIKNDLKEALIQDNHDVVLSLLKMGARLSDVVTGAIVWASLDVIVMLINEEFLSPNEAMKKAIELPSSVVMSMLLKYYRKSIDRKLRNTAYQKLKQIK